MKLIYIISLFLFFFLFNCQETSTESPPVSNTINFSPNNISSPLGEGIDISLNMVDLKEQIFAISMHITHDNDDVIKRDAATILSGDLFSQDAVYFVKVTYDKIYVSITLIKESLMVSGSGSLCLLQFTDPSSGECNLSIDPTTINCFNSDGNLIDVALKVNTAKITIQ